MKILIAALLILHGLIVAAQSSGGFKPPTGGLPNPAWVAWWPTNLGQSWLLSTFGLERMPFTTLVSLINLAGGLALIGAGLGVLGLLIPASWWGSLAVGGAALSLFMLAVYLHPFYVVGIGANIALLVALLWLRWPSPGILPR
jgi:hypothetical protein